MLGKRSAQRGLFEADTRYGEFVGQRTFYGFLASQRDELFRDEDFAALYSCERGRPSVPPSLLATALVLQTYDDVSDEEALRIIHATRPRMLESARDGMQERFKVVYGLTGRPCPRCGERSNIRACGQGDDNRTTYWCPRCQR